MKIFKILARILTNLPEIVSASLLIVICILLFLQTALRYLFAIQIGWAEEGSRFTLIWLTFLGAAICSKRQLHSRVAFLAAHISGSTRRHIALVTEGIMAAFAVIMIWKGIAIVQITQYERWTILGLPMSYSYASVPVSGALILIYALKHLALLLRSDQPSAG